MFFIPPIFPGRGQTADMGNPKRDHLLSHLFVDLVLVLILALLTVIPYLVYGILYFSFDLDLQGWPFYLVVAVLFALVAGLAYWALTWLSKQSGHDYRSIVVKVYLLLYVIVNVILFDNNLLRMEEMFYYTMNLNDLRLPSLRIYMNYVFRFRNWWMGPNSGMAIWVLIAEGIYQSRQQREIVR